VTRGRSITIAVFAVMSAVGIAVVVYANSATRRSSGCDRGDALDCANLAVRYENGANVPKDEHRASELYQQACTGGIAWACGSLGELYAEGRGVSVDYARALPLLTKGCDGSCTAGCYGLGELYRDGHGVAIDLPRARELFGRACRANAPSGRNVHASGHEHGCDEEQQIAARLRGGSGK
jgi:TPR repeat protein